MGGVNHGLKVILVHVPRTGGSAMEVALGVDHIHDTMQQARQRHGEKAWDEYFKFGFVREPLTRLISCFEFAQAEKSWYHDNVDSGPQGSHGDRHPDFDTLRGRTLEDACRMLLADRDSLKQPGWKPQTHFISDPDGLDFIGRYENLAEDWRYVCWRLGVDIELPRINETTQIRDRTQYMTPFVVEFASRFYRADYATFGYPLPLPIVPDAEPVPAAVREAAEFWSTADVPRVQLATSKGCCGK